MAEQDLCYYAKLPDELLLHISKYLTNVDNRRLRLSARRLGACSVLEFKRVFMSANAEDLLVVRTVAERQEWAQTVQELVWHDAHFATMAPDEQGSDELNSESGQDGSMQSHGETGSPSTSESAAHSHLRDEQMDIIRHNAHATTLRDVLPRFLNLKRVVITDRVDHEARLLYPTPMMRLYEDQPEASMPVMQTWGVSRRDPRLFPGEVWRGFRIVVNELAANRMVIEELILDTDNDDDAGLPFEFIANSVDRIEDGTVEGLEEICSRGIHHLKLSFDVAPLLGIESGLRSFATGRLGRILHGARFMKQLSLRTNAHLTNTIADTTESSILKDMPMSCFPVLETLTLSRLFVEAGDLHQLFRNIAPTIRILHFTRVMICMEKWRTALPDLMYRLPHTNQKLLCTVVTDVQNTPWHVVRDPARTVKEVVATFEHEGKWLTTLLDWEVIYFDVQ